LAALRTIEKARISGFFIFGRIFGLCVYAVLPGSAKPQVETISASNCQRYFPGICFIKRYVFG